MHSKVLYSELVLASSVHLIFLVCSSCLLQLQIAFVHAHEGLICSVYRMFRTLVPYFAVAAEAVLRGLISHLTDYPV